MRTRIETRWRMRMSSPRFRSALGGVFVGISLSLLLVAAPLWLFGGAGRSSLSAAGTAPLAALATMPDEPVQFDIADILDGSWAGEMCPDEGEPVAVYLEFAHREDNTIAYSLSLDGERRSEEILTSGACDVDGEEIAFHTFLAILSDCDEACGVDRFYEGHFDEGGLVGRYSDAAAGEKCLSCVGGGSWWLEPEA